MVLEELKEKETVLKAETSSIALSPTWFKSLVILVPFSLF